MSNVAKPAAIAATESRLNMRTVFRLGRHYLGRWKTLVLIYIIGFLLCQTIFPAGIALSAGTLTNYFEQAFSQHKSDQVRAGQLSNEDTPVQANRRGLRDRPQELTHQQLLVFYFLWVGLTLVAVVTGFGHKYAASMLAGSVSNDIRKDVFSSILNRPPGFFHEKGSDQLTMLVNQFPLQVQMALQALLIDPLLNLIGITVLGFTLYKQLTAHAQQGGYQVWLFFGVIFLLALVSPWLVSLMGRRLERSAKGFQEQNLLIASLVGGALKAPEEIQSMCAEAIFNRKHQNALGIALQRRLDQTLIVERLNIVNRLPGEIVLISLLGLAVYLVLTGSSIINGGVVIALFLLTPQFMGAIQGLSGISINARLNAPALDTVASILDQVPIPAGSLKEYSLEQVDAKLEARNLIFSYAPDSKKLLDDVSFSLLPRKITGLVARAGQGKTTFFRLALRFYEPDHGQILIGGVPHTHYSLENLRQRMVLMHQTPAFFYDTIRENFLMANPRATDVQIRSLCEQTLLWQILVESYGCDPLDRPFFAGSFLSGGQKKLFALTRCLLRDPTFLFLDEPTTGMDSEEKLDLVTMMRQACAGKTVLAVDHDLVGWQVLFCDYFIVLNEGKIEQQGTPGELLSQPGLFKNLFDKQAEGFHQMAAVIRRIETAHATDSLEGDPKKYLAS
jgi:ATP-binding cassette, subfamily B, bacterial